MGLLTFLAFLATKITPHPGLIVSFVSLATFTSTCLVLACPVDAKSTKNKLSDINSGRLAAHREKIGGVYTIVVTPRYVPAVLQDIKTSPIVIIRASTFSEYLFNCIDNDLRKIDYEDFDSIIVDNLGKDISKSISNLTIARFATKS